MGAACRKAYNCKVFVLSDPHDVEVAMKYVLLGNLSPEYASKQSGQCRAVFVRFAQKQTNTDASICLRFVPTTDSCTVVKSVIHHPAAS